MTTLREIVNTAQGVAVDAPPVQRKLQVRDQVVLRRPVGFSGKTKEMIRGEILAFGDGGKSAVVSIPRPGGVTTRATVRTDQLQPAKGPKAIQWGRM